MRERKDEMNKKHKARHQPALSAIVQKTEHTVRTNKEKEPADKEERNFTGKDIDLMNYTDL